MNGMNVDAAAEAIRTRTPWTELVTMTYGDAGGDIRIGPRSEPDELRRSPSCPRLGVADPFGDPCGQLVDHLRR